MFTTTRPIRTSAAPEAAPPHVGVDMDQDAPAPVEPDLADLVARHGLPLVVLDIARAARQYRWLRESFPTVDVHYDVSALAHPALIEAIAADDGYFEVSHDSALAALTAAHADQTRVLHATPVTHPHEVLAAYNAGVRRFVVDGPSDVEKFVGYPADLRLLVRLRPGASPHAAHALPRGVRAEDGLRLVRYAASLGVRIAGFSLSLPADASASEYIVQIARTVALMADIEAATGARFDVLDLGDAFPGRAAGRPGERAELARAIIAPATSHVAITASASRAVTTGCITVIGGTVERDVDPLIASDCIDDGADVAVVGCDDERSGPFFRFPFFRTVSPSRHRVLRGGPRGATAGSSAG
jgi:ornithine decarboxylase